MTDAAASYQKAPETEVAATPGVAVSVKQGKICCGGCCDMRRATIVVNIVHLAFLAMGLLAMIAATSAANNLSQYDDDNLFDDKFESELGSFKAMGVAGIVMFLFFMIVHGLGLYGAVSYTSWMIMASFVFYVLETIYAVVKLDPTAIMYGFFAYPHYYLWEEIRAGIMTPENYPNEIHSCCCV